MIKHRISAAATLLAAALALMLVAADGATAGTYRVGICNPGIGAGHANATFRRTSSHYVSESSCGRGKAGLAVRHEGRQTGAGRWGGWSVRAPQGTVISHLGVSAAGRRSGGQIPQLMAAPLQGSLRPFAVPDPGVERSRWTRPARSFAARLRCAGGDGCGRGRRAAIRVKRLALRVVDRVRPTIAVRGSAFVPGSRRGVQTIEASASDVGAGVHRFLMQVNGEPITARGTPCQVEDGYALRMRPCPQSARTRFRAATTASPFRQGPNLVRICSVDYAPGTMANRACTERRVRIDNLCPISSTGPGPRLDAQLSRSSHRGQGRGARHIRGRVLSPAGVPVAGARVCVAARVPTAGAVERVVATPTTGPDGRFRADLPKGPNRQVRVAYWWSGSQVAERHLSLRVHARPHLRLRPHHPLHTGRRVRFRLRLQGPAAGHRWVRIQARAGKRWVELNNGRTNGRGAYHAHYRFHATSGRHRYAFRAVVPKQRGYPYRGGHSKIRRVTVIG